MTQATQLLREWDFFRGLFAELAIKGYKTFHPPQDRIDQVLWNMFSWIEERAQEEGLQLGFQIQLHKIHRDSLKVYENVNSMLASGWFTRDSPGGTLRLNISTERAKKILLETCVGGEQFYSDVADTFLEAYRR